MYGSISCSSPQAGYLSRISCGRATYATKATMHVRYSALVSVQQVCSAETAELCLSSRRATTYFLDQDYANTTDGPLNGRSQNFLGIVNMLEKRSIEIFLHSIQT